LTFPRIDGHAEELVLLDRRCLWGKGREAVISAMNSRGMPVQWVIEKGIYPK